ncbi:MAG: hypothetical protein ACM3S1_13350 [Hyphomicrobiales bacterium]
MPSWRLPLATLCACSGLLLFAACGDGEAGEPSSTASDPGGAATTDQRTNVSTGDIDTTTSPKLEGPASKYSLLNPDDFGPGYITNISQTFELNVDNYTRNNHIFESPEQGKKTMESWGYDSGYETMVDPEGRDIARSNGAFGVIQEVHLFKDEEGAKQAYQYFKNALGGTGRVSPVGIEPVGNESVAWRYISGKLNPTTNMAYYVVLFRRGNLVASVVTNGSDVLLKSDSARDFAVLIDQKALGKRAAFTPTPTSNYTPPASSAKTPTPTGGGSR